MKFNSWTENKKSDPIQPAQSPPPCRAPVPWCVDRLDLKWWVLVHERRKDKNPLESEIKMMKNNAWLVLLCFWFLFFSLFHCDSCWSVVVLIAGLHSGGSKPFPDQSMGHPTIFYLVQDHACHFYEDIFNLQFRHVSVMNTTQLFYFCWKKPRGDVCNYSISEVSGMDLFKVISAEINPPEEIAVSIAHDLLGFPGYVRYRYWFLDLSWSSLRWTQQGMWGVSIMEAKSISVRPKILINRVLCIPSWWFQPLWKILVKMGIFPK